MTYLHEALFELIEELEEDELVSIFEGIHNRALAQRLRKIIEETDRLDDR